MWEDGTGLCFWASQLCQQPSESCWVLKHGDCPYESWILEACRPVYRGIETIVWCWRDWSTHWRMFVSVYEVCAGFLSNAAISAANAEQTKAQLLPLSCLCTFHSALRFVPPTPILGKSATIRLELPGCRPSYAVVHLFLFFGIPSASHAIVYLVKV